jgi:hypothetical protein
VCNYPAAWEGESNVRNLASYLAALLVSLVCTQVDFWWANIHCKELEAQTKYGASLLFKSPETLPCYKYIDLAILRFLINYIMNFSLISPADIVSGE